MKRSSAIIMSVSSLPSPYGIGSLGRCAYEFADFLKAAGQSYWQFLPIGPTSYGDSPYQSFSSWAGNPYYIDLDMLEEDGLLTKEEIDKYDCCHDARHVDYGMLYEKRFALLRLAAQRGLKRDRDALAQFAEANPWLDSYALFMACKCHFSMKSWLCWDDDELRERKPEALEKYRKLLKDDIDFYSYLQYLFFGQWDRLLSYIHSLGLKTIGDIPFYAALDSADVWSEAEFFSLDEKFLPREVAGVPPDYFCEDGQLWGNPLYNWDAMKADGYGWWIRRVGAASQLFDVIRIDHFKGFSEYWAVPYGEKTARNGLWRKGPGMDLVGVLSGWFNTTEFVAEDLGVASEALTQLLKDSGWPGMKVLQFAFDSAEASNYLPHSYSHNCICYSGTHDNATLMEWLADASLEDKTYAAEYLGLIDMKGRGCDGMPAGRGFDDMPAGHGFDGMPSECDCDDMPSDEKLCHAIICAGAGSVADLWAAQLQDYMFLGKGNRMNTPGTLGGNWTWRALREEINPSLAGYIRKIMEMYGRV